MHVAAIESNFFFWPCKQILNASYAILTFRFKYEILYSIDFKAFYSSQRAFENNLKLIINMAFFEHPLLPAMRDIINTTQCQVNF